MKYNGGVGIFEQSVFACIPDRSVWEESQLHLLPFEMEALFQDAFLRRKTIHTHCQSRHCNATCSREEWSLKLNDREWSK